MAPTPATSALAYIKQCNPVLRGEVSKVAYLMHAYAILSDCTLIGVDERPGEARAEEMQMPTVLEKQDFTSLRYRTPAGSCLEIAVMRADNKLLLHWASHGGDVASAASPINSVSIPEGRYFTESECGANAYQREVIPELMDKFMPGLDLMLQEAEAMPATPVGAEASKPQRPDSPQSDPMSALPPVQPVHGIHPQPTPLMDGLPARGGSHVGPNDPMFAGLVQGRHDLWSSVHPPGGRFDPIAPDGLPGSNPDDFVGPGQIDGWHDLGPPPGRNFPGRGAHRQDPFGGFM